MPGLCRLRRSCATPGRADNKLRAALGPGWLHTARRTRATQAAPGARYAGSCARASRGQPWPGGGRGDGAEPESWRATTMAVRRGRGKEGMERGRRGAHLGEPRADAAVARQVRSRAIWGGRGHGVGCLNGGRSGRSRVLASWARCAPWKTDGRLK
jgi:hypothetical protein